MLGPASITCPRKCCPEKDTSLRRSFCPNAYLPESGNDEPGSYAADKSSLESVLQNNWPVLFMKDAKEARDCSRLKEARESWGHERQCGRDIGEPRWDLITKSRKLMVGKFQCGLDIG